eukprot:3103933-Prymnesium_polylepis.1
MFLCGVCVCLSVLPCPCCHLHVARHSPPTPRDSPHKSSTYSPRTPANLPSSPKHMVPKSIISTWAVVIPSVPPSAASPAW